MTFGVWAGVGRAQGKLRPATAPLQPPFSQPLLLTAEARMRAAAEESPALAPTATGIVRAGAGAIDYDDPSLAYYRTATALTDGGMALG